MHFLYKPLLILLPSICVETRHLDYLQHGELFSSLYGDLMHSELESGDKGVENEMPPFRNKYSGRLKAASIAQNAAHVATAANDAQMSAAQEAARQVKIQLADKAEQAARAAEAVLEGKQALVHNYEREIREADAMICEVSNSLESSKSNAIEANEAAKSAEMQLTHLNCMYQEAAGSLANVEALDEQAHADYEEKIQMLALAQARADQVNKQVAKAKEDYEVVKKSAYRAACAAVEAKKKAKMNQSNCKRADAMLSLYRQRREPTRWQRRTKKQKKKWYNYKKN